LGQFLKYPIKLSQFCEIINNLTSGWCGIKIRSR